MAWTEKHLVGAVLVIFAYFPHAYVCYNASMELNDDINDQIKGFIYIKIKS